MAAEDSSNPVLDDGSDATAKNTDGCIENAVAKTDESPKDEVESDTDVPPEGDGLSSEIYEVEKVLEHVYDDANELFFLVHWRGYTKADDSWEPADNLVTAAVAIREYWERQKEKEEKKLKKGEAKRPDKKSDKKQVKKKTTLKSDSKAPTSARSRRAASRTPLPDASPSISARSRRAASRTPLPDASTERSPSIEGEDNADDSFEVPSKGRKRASNASTPSKKVTSKGALKSFETGPSTPAPMSSLKRSVLNNRSTWLDEDDSDDEPLNSKKSASPVPTTETTTARASSKTPEIKATSASPVPTPEIKLACTDSIADDAEEPVEEKPVVPILKRKGKDVGTPQTKKNKGENSSVSTEDVPVSANFDGEVSVLGVACHNGAIQVVVSGVDGGQKSSTLSVEDAYKKCGFKLVQFLIDRLEFRPSK